MGTRVASYNKSATGAGQEYDSQINGDHLFNPGILGSGTGVCVLGGSGELFDLAFACETGVAVAVVFPFACGFLPVPMGVLEGGVLFGMEGSADIEFIVLAFFDFVSLKGVLAASSALALRFLDFFSEVDPFSSGASVMATSPLDFRTDGSGGRIGVGTPIGVYRFFNTGGWGLGGLAVISALGFAVKSEAAS